MTAGWQWKTDGSNTVGVQVLSHETADSGVRYYTYIIEVRRPGKDPESVGQRTTDAPFDTPDEARKAGWREAERLQRVRLP